MAIRDVSTQWAAMLESEAEEDKKYSKACEKACEAMEKAEEIEIQEFDEEEIDPSECGFTEEDLDCETIDPLKMWKDAKQKQKPITVKVDANYINTMKKLLSKIKYSKAQLYNTVMTKLEGYRASGTELPPPEDFAENFIPFEMIARIAGGFEDSRADSEDDEEKGKVDVGDEDLSLGSQAKREYSDTDNAFGNDMAMQNMYDSELTEEEEEEAKQKAIAALDDAKKETKKVDIDSVKKFLEKHGNEMKKQIASLKNPETRDRMTTLLKIIEKVADGELTADDLKKHVENTFESKKANSNKTKSVPVQFIKGTIRLFVWFLKIAPLGILGTAWTAKKIAQASKWVLDKADKSLAESCQLECSDEAEAIEEADAEEIAEDGVSVKEADSEEFEEEEFEEVEEAACKNQDDPASHLLDVVGVKASTANLKGQDAAMISVVEMLMKKIDKLEAQLNEAKQIDLSKRQGSITQLFIANKAEADATKTKEQLTHLVKRIFADAGLDTPASRRTVMNFERSRSWLNSLTYYYNIIEKGTGNGVIEADSSEDDADYEDVLDDLSLTKQQREDYEAAKKLQDISYRRTLTKAEENKFRELFQKLPDIAHDYLLNNTMGPAGFARPGDVPLLDDPTVHPDDGGGDGMGGYKKRNVDWDSRVQIPPFNYKQGSHRETSFERQKKQKAADAAGGKALEFPERGMRDPDGKKGVWNAVDWNRLLSNLNGDEKEALKADLIADVKAEGKARGTSTRQIASEIAFIKNNIFGEQVTSRDLTKMFYKDIDWIDDPDGKKNDEIEKKRVGIDKFTRATIEVIKDALTQYPGNSIKAAQYVKTQLGLRNKKSKIAKIPSIDDESKEEK